MLRNTHVPVLVWHLLRVCLFFLFFWQIKVEHGHRARLHFKRVGWGFWLQASSAHKKKRYTYNERIKEICKDLYLVLQFFVAKKKIHHSASADSRRKNLGSGGRFYFSPSLFNFLSYPKVLPWVKLSSASVLQKKTRWQTRMQALKAASHINVRLKQRKRGPEKFRELICIFFSNSETCVTSLFNNKVTFSISLVSRASQNQSFNIKSSYELRQVFNANVFPILFHAAHTNRSFLPSFIQNIPPLHEYNNRTKTN